MNSKLNVNYNLAIFWFAFLMVLLSLCPFHINGLDKNIYLIGCALVCGMGYITSKAIVKYLEDMRKEIRGLRLK